VGGRKPGILLPIAVAQRAAGTCLAAGIQGAFAPKREALLLEGGEGQPLRTRECRTDSALTTPEQLHVPLDAMVVGVTALRDLSRQRVCAASEAAGEAAEERTGLGPGWKVAKRAFDHLIAVLEQF
jgi:hypothetical protein